MTRRNGSPDPIYAAIGARIRQRREQMEYTQTDIAKHLKMSLPGYMYYETGQSSIPLHNLIKIAKKLRKPPEWFLGDVPELDADADEHELLAFYRGMPPELKPSAKKFIQLAALEEERKQSVIGRKAE